MKNKIITFSQPCMCLLCVLFGMWSATYVADFLIGRMYERMPREARAATLYRTTDTYRVAFPRQGRSWASEKPIMGSEEL